MSEPFLKEIMSPDKFKEYFDEMLGLNHEEMVNMYGEVESDHPLFEYMTIMGAYLRTVDVRYLQGVMCGLCFVERSLVLKTLKNLEEK